MKTPESRIVILACILTGVIAFGTPSAAQFYKWTDAAGTVHFSDNPPPRAAGGPKVEVLPEAPSRPPTVRRAAPPEEPAPPEPVAEVPPQPEMEDANDYGTEPSDEDVGSDVPIVDDAASDAAVRWRANSPRNRPGGADPFRTAPALTHAEAAQHHVMTHCNFARLGAYAGLLLLSGCAHGASGAERAPRFSAPLIAKIRMIELDQGQCSLALRELLEVGDAVLRNDERDERSR